MIPACSIGNAKISGMQTDLNLSSNQYSVPLVVFFVGYVIFEVPSNLVLGRTRPSISLPSIMLVWGTLTCLMAVVKEFRHLVVLRVLIGCVEAGFAPGVLLVLSSWYKRTEQSKRFGVYISAAILSGAFGGLLAALIVKYLEGVHGIRGWRWLFIVEGAATIGWALVAGYMVIVGSSTLTYFYPTLVKGLFGNASTEKINFLTMPIYEVAFICTAITAYFSDKIPAWRGLVIACWLTFSLICSIVICVVYDFTARYVLLVLMAAGL
ncbi:hypothetical protein PENSUB_8331 [Penicillium subrubescens]|uniref:Major facilitator superfamily (MFS) profile domain-containing protein n=1 Tax=Penicillium subrubescens TaxID=1316194 RepID=A0A1Q5THG2_9EURO|nr:hypothetical protein PENSUB_8331 [Penicillium subrubescens]